MAAIILAAVLAAAPPASASSSVCGNALIRPTAGSGSIEGRKLADMPPAYLMHAVLRQVGDCSFAEVRLAPGVWRNVAVGQASPAMRRVAQPAPSDRPPSSQ
jgi:hypothetical protein